jgi:malate synthase
VLTRTLNPDRNGHRALTGRSGLPGRSLLFVRNVGHLMTNPAILLADGSEIPEGIMDAVITSAIGAHDLARDLAHIATAARAASTSSSPRCTGRRVRLHQRPVRCGGRPAGLPRHTIKVGVMDEERRTSANLAACIHAVKDRIVFINTGFLDRTGDEIHTSMRAGPMIRKGAMKGSAWIAAYEARNVQIGLKPAGFRARRRSARACGPRPT